MICPNDGLKRAVWKRLEETIITDCKRSTSWKILMLDPFTTKLLSLCCTMSRLASEGITLVWDLHKRQPAPGYEAIYFMSPTTKSVGALIDDFKVKPKYKTSYVYFTEYCPDDLFKLVKLYCAKFIRVCREINISFLPQEAQVFTCEIPGAFQSIYGLHNQHKQKTLETLADQIVSLCATLDEHPVVRYKNSNLENAKQLADIVDNKLTRLFESDDRKGKTRARLLLVERDFDPISPILHELTYQAMAYDLIPIQNNTYKYMAEVGSVKEVFLNEEDSLWVKLRHMHIAEVSKEMSKLWKEVQASAKSIQPGEANIPISGLRRMVEEKLATRKELSQITNHVHLTEDCVNRFHDVEELCKVEQDLAVGLDVHGSKVKDPMKCILPVLLHPYSTYDKIRAVLLYIFNSNGTTEENLRKLIQHVNIDKGFILNWKKLGVPIISSPPGLSPHKPTRRDRSREHIYDLSRWTPVIKDIMEDAVENKLDAKTWPHQSECPGMAWYGSGAVSVRQKHKATTQDERCGRSRLIIFILGGMCYSEMRCAYQVTQKVKSCEVIIGSSHIVTPISFLEDIQSLSKGPIESYNVEDRKKVLDCITYNSRVIGTTMRPTRNIGGRGSSMAYRIRKVSHRLVQQCRKLVTRKKKHDDKEQT